MGIIVRSLLIALPVIGVLWLIGVTDYLGFQFFEPQYLGIFMALTLCLTFLLTPATKGAPIDRLSWYDALLALSGMAAGCYLTVFYVDLLYQPLRATPADLIIGSLTILLSLEASRRLLGWALTGIGSLFILYGLYCEVLPGFLHAKGHSWSYLVPYLCFQTSGIPGMVLGIVSTIILAYLLFGQTLLGSGGGKLVTDFTLCLVGRFRGGPAKVAVVASSLFGTMSGSSVSNVVITGTFTIPMMKGAGYRPTFAGAVEAVSSTGGLIMPPVMGAAAFLVAEFLGIGYAQVVIAAIFPAVLYYTAVFAQVDLEAAKAGLRGLPPGEIPALKTALRASWQFILPLAVLVYFLLIRMFPAATAALYAIVSVVIVSFFRKESRLGLRRILAISEATGRTLLDIGVVALLSGIVIGVVNLTGLSMNLSRFLTGIMALNLFVVLLLAAVTSTILGMGLPMSACYILLAILVAPALVELGLQPLAAHLFIFYFGALSFLTPPIAVAAYASATLAGSAFIPTGLQAMRLAIVAYIVPFIFVYNPALLMQGSAISLAPALITAIAGALFLSAGIEGYLFCSIGWVGRILFILGGVGLIVPGWQTDLIALAPLLWERRLVSALCQRLLSKGVKLRK